MSTLTLPYVNLAADSGIDAAKVQANFDAIANFFNGIGNGLDAGNINAAAAFTSSQMAEPRTLVWLNAQLPSPSSNAGYFAHWKMHRSADVIGIRLNIQKSDAAKGALSVQYGGLTPDHRLYEGAFRQMTYDDSMTSNWGDARPPPFGILSLPVNYGLWLAAIAGATANITMLTVQLLLAVRHEES